ncbi:E3 ubiquitin-protein ligase RNF213 isoform X3 [Lepus europaeus]|uniref:E3 ubiquitin-protein ligase RNF213 isoform X3 n=1 Tax=Lepus europaeus TaxID=9983 RepID=UPI002B470826|nr:E3 ubiquitin-protein ligase RNF213 isoform X3 [Lepus europaeus]
MGSKNDSGAGTVAVASVALEADVQCVDTARAGDGPPASSPGSGDWQESADEPGSDASWTVQLSKKKRKKIQGRAASSKPGPSPLPAPGPSSLEPLWSPGPQDTARSQPPPQGTGPKEPAPGDSGPGPQDLRKGEGLGPGHPPGGRGLSGAGPSPAAATAAPELLLAESPRDDAGPGQGPRNELQPARRPEGAPASGAVEATAEPADGAGKEMKGKAQKSKQPPASTPASQKQGQEAEPKDATTVTGDKTDKNKKAKLEAPKKPEGSSRHHAASLKSEKSQEGGSREAPESGLSPGEGVTVYFHAILSKDFSFDPSHHKVFVRGGEELGKTKWTDVCEMNYTRDLHENGSLIEGSLVISRQHLDKAIPYKYVVYRDKGTAEYEFIYKQQQKEGEHVNRCLCVKSTLVGSGDWHQYDDIICMKPPGKFRRFLDKLTDGTQKDLVRGKQLAAGIMLDSIFSVLRPWSPVNLGSFFTQLQQLYAVVRVPMVYEGQAQPWKSLQYEEAQVKEHLWQYLKKKMAPFLEGKGGEHAPGDGPVSSKLRMGLIVLFSVEKFNLCLPQSDLGLLCCLLAPSARGADALHRDLSHFPGTSHSWRAFLVNLCQRCMESKVDSWLAVLPVLHYFMELSPPSRDAARQPEDSWAALQGISFWTFREKTPEPNQLLQVMERNQHLLGLDQYLFRSWFSLLPLGQLVHYMESFAEHLTGCPARVLDCLLGTAYRLQELSWVGYLNAQAIQRTFQMLLHLLDICQTAIVQEALLQACRAVCLRLHELACGLTKSVAFYEIPALSAETVCKLLVLQPAADSVERPGEAARRSSGTAAFQETLATTRAWLQGVFKENMLKNSHFSDVRFTYPHEIQVWRRLVEIGFPVELGWKESLLGDLEGRLTQERPLAQISAYCSTRWDTAGPEDSVAQSFEKCVIEAVSSACQSQTSVLEGVSCQDLRKFGTLVSAVITKSWPRSCGEATDDFDEILEHLLTGPDVKHLFKLYGTDEKILANITEEGKKLMAAADSVLTTAAAELVSGSILVGHLELILRHRAQFLDVWRLQRKASSSREDQCDVEELLGWRKAELDFLKTERRRVGSLLSQCGKVQHLVQVDFGEMAVRHAEDLSRTRLNAAVTVRPPASSDEELATHYHLSPEARGMAEQIDLLKDSHVFQLFWEEAAQSLGLPEPLGEAEDEPQRPVVTLDAAHDALFCPCYKKFLRFYRNLKSGEVTLAEVHVVFKDFVNKYSDLALELHAMSAVDGQGARSWIYGRVQQVEEYHSLHQAVHSAKVILQVKEALGLTGSFSVLYTLLNFTDDFDKFRHEKLDRISPQLIQAKKLLQDISEPRCQCLRELSLCREFIGWLRDALADINELKVFVDLASISAGENDIDVDRVACFHDAVQGYAPLLYKLSATADFTVFMDHLRELWKALDNDKHLPKKLRDSARNLEWLKTVKESHGSVELSSLSLATAINSRGIYVLEAPQAGHRISPDMVLRLNLPQGQGWQDAVRSYTLEELKELLNKLMLLSGQRDHNSSEVERFSEVFCRVQRLVQAFIDLHSAGNMLFRTWTAEVRCSATKVVSIRLDFGLELLAPLTGRGDELELLEAVCRLMERFLARWEAFVTRQREEHFYLNLYTAEQLVYLSAELPRAPPSEAALTMLGFVKGGCTPTDVLRALSGSGGEVARARASATLQELWPVLLAEFNLEKQLSLFLEQAVDCMGAFVPHCLDLDTLGRCLARLASLGGPLVERRLPQGLQAGRPNLILCAQAEVLPAALAVYMQAPGQPLPTYDEVLLCTPGTSFEEVALLLRRCLTPGCQGRRLYSLLFADRLSYEVACRVEALFHSLCARHHRDDYQLVLLCDSDREHCCLPSAFSQQKVLVTPQAPLDTIQAYLAQHYQVPEQIPSAAAVFRDRMCVGIVASERAGVGKSLYVQRLHSRLRQVHRQRVPLKTIRLMEPEVDESHVLSSLVPFLNAQSQSTPMIFHLDVTSSVRAGVEAFLFKLLVLQYLMDVHGKMWLRNPRHLYLVEILEDKSALARRPSRRGAQAPHFSFLDVFPKVTCRPPKEVLGVEPTPEPGMDQQEFRSETFQRPYQYLRRFHLQQDLDAFRYRQGSVEGSPGECLQLLLLHCGVVNPSWAELQNFARFLNYQLRDCEASLFCDSGFTGDTLQGFKSFVVTFMIFMARDFATPTLQTSDQSPGKHLVSMDGVREEDLAPFLLRRRWESEPHPYVFFNDDHVSMTFIGFHLQPNQAGGVDAVNHLNGQVIKKDVMTQELYQGLLLQGVPFNVDFDTLPRHEKLERLCLALGVQWPVDPDETYELTTDNMLKILAIEMRFRCGIPVVIMGETGCGKTRLIKFLSDLRRGGAMAETMRLVKVHGGTTADTIRSRVREAERVAFRNRAQHELDTILFFDEANTTEAVSCIKEVLCDRTVGGQPLAKNSGLHIIAACNPYRRHTQEMIRRLESAGLGYRVSVQETADRLGSIPLRQLVYRVHALPPSLVPLVWDFGQLSRSAERLYILQIVQRSVDRARIDEGHTRVMAAALCASQAFMRSRENECGFVSLRDVERCVAVFRWFHERSEALLGRLDSFLDEAGVRKGGHVERDPVLWALVLALGVCYHASLEKKESYWRVVCQLLPRPYDSSKAVLEEISQTQALFLHGVPLRQAIARNAALKENVFMMVVCIELKIPLFLVGKPGSSKSLAKTIVADAMQGPAAHSELFRGLKQVHLVSFQCSPHSTPQGIIGTFRQCARFQQGKDLQQYVSVVVLDEVGLAEDSPRMPLKALHPLLEDGCIDDHPAPHKKVGFIGISNWALDPAKMNRGIFVARGSPSKKELIDSARGICSSDGLVLARVQGYFAPFARAYETVCRSQDKEFFGLRDYYSLIKMVFATAKASLRMPAPRDIARAVLRNFSGKDDIPALDIFCASLPEARCSEEVSTLQLIRQNIFGDARAPGAGLEEPEVRYLLVLTRNYVALQILQQLFLGAGQQPEIIFGSSFPKDQEYAQICRNINRVKVCMETGRMVVLLNLQSLYESLYDALNQYYVRLGGHKYVDLGLGTHRVKCRVHPGFRLIVIEEKDVVYRQFPVPLVNRLEKHYLDIHTVLPPWQRGIAQELEAWVAKFVDLRPDQLLARHKYSPADVFIGFHSDTCASVVLQVAERLGARDLTDEHYQQVLEEAKLALLGCATPDAVVRLSASSLGGFTAQGLSREYYRSQQHDSFADFLQAQLRTVDQGCRAVFTEVTTFSRLLTSQDCECLGAELSGRAPRPAVLSLQQFDTEYSFLKEVRNCLATAARCKILIVQTDFEDGAHSAQLIASAKYSATNEINKLQGREDCVLVYFITKLSRMGSDVAYVGFHGGLWHSVHIDDLHRSTVMASDVTRLQNIPISQLFPQGDGPEPKGDHEGDVEMGVDESGAVEVVEMETESPEGMERGAPAPAGSDVPLLDTTQLLQSCVQSAVGMLRDPAESGQRNMRRVELLLGLLSGDAAFLQVLKVRLHGLLRKQEESQLRSQDWVVRAASNQDALQEAGTFRNSLWKRVQGVVTLLLASVVSFIDRDGNLELLARPRPPAWARSLWMFIFTDAKLLDIPLVTSDTRSKGEVTSILVQNHMSLAEGANDTPFSWRIKDYLEELWMQAQYITDAEGLPGKVAEIFRQTPLGSFVARLPAEQQQELLQCFLRDFVRLSMSVSTGEEFKLLQMALWSCMRELSAASGQPEDGLSLPWVLLAQQRFGSRLQNLSRILTLQPQVLPSLAQKHDLAGSEMTLDVFAAMACTEMLTRDTLKPSARAWLQQVKSLSTPLELVCSEGHLQGSGHAARTISREVRAQWRRISSVALFVEHVLLGAESQIPELCPQVTSYVFSLNKCLQENSDLKAHRPFQAVMATLCECKDTASKALARFGVEPCPICLGDAQDPVCLPCDHVFCLHCLRAWLAPGQMLCPLCLTDLPDRFQLTVSQEHSMAIAKHAQFRQLCNSFFVDLVSSMCFRDDCPPHGDVVQSLLSLLFVQKELLRREPQGPREHTKSLSPFNDVVDKTPVIRSVVLKLLLKYSFREVQDYLQDYLSLLEKKSFLVEDKTELYRLFLNCLEDSMQEKASACPRNEALSLLREDSRFLQAQRPGGPGQERPREASVRYLQEVARIRRCLDRACGLLSELQEDAEMAEEQQSYLSEVERFCARAQNDWYRVYLVRKLASQRGMEFVQRLSAQGHPCQWVFPREVVAQQKDHVGHLDRFLVHGEEYKAVRDAVGKAVLEGNALGIAAALKACRKPSTQQAAHLLLALFQEVAVLYRSQHVSLHPKPEQREALNAFIEENQALLSPDMRAFAVSLVANSLPLLSTGPGDSSLEGAVVELAVHSAAVLLSGRGAILAPLRNLAFSPASMAGAYLPTMPEDLLAQARSWRGLEGLQWYTCPNGHPCSVGECGKPMEQSQCVDCGAQVGGINHIPNAGFHVITSDADRTQTGHVLGDPQNRGTAVAPDRELSPVAFVLIRLLTHLALLWGAAQDPQALMKIVKPRVWDLRGFLQQHVQRDLGQLTAMLGRSADETASVAHLVLGSLLHEQHPVSSQRPVHYDAQLSTKEKRNDWEKHVEALILPVLEHLDKTLLRVNALISQDERISSNPVAKIVYGDPAAFLSHLPRESVVHCSKVWSCRRRITVEYLQHVVEQKNGKETVPVLWQFLQKEAELRLVRFLPEILALQRSLVRQFQNAPDAEYRSIRGFISSQGSDGRRHRLHQQITVFLSTWNQLRRSLGTNGEIKLPEDYCRSDLDLDSDFGVLLPRRRGLGLCATALVSYLISLHNGMVCTVEKFSTENRSYSVDASDVAELHVISYDVERDLTPLILSNCQYRVERGGEALQELDLDKIQRQVVGRFLQGKPKVTLKGIPTLVYRRDWNYEHLFMDIRNKMAQNPLPSSVAGAITGQLQAYSDACEALSVTEVALGFLSTAGGDPSMHLNVYTQDVLRMAGQSALVVKALSRCQLKHAIALWQLLSAHKSEQLLRLKREPFGDISPQYKEDLSPEDARLLRAFLKQHGLDAFLLELHEMMVLKLAGLQPEDGFNPAWSLRDTLLCYLDTKECELPGLEAQFPEQILMSSCVAVWKAAAALKQERQVAQ